MTSRPAPDDFVYGSASAARQSQHLGLPQARAVCEAAATLGQVYGLSFNLLLAFHHRGSDHSASTRVVTDFHRRAHQRLQRRGQALFPFVYVHEVRCDGALATRLACRVDFALDEEFLTWIEIGFAPSRAGRATRLESIECRQGNAHGECISFQERCLRALLSGVDPALKAYDGAGHPVPLIEVLGVSPDQRRTLGLVTCPQRFGSADALGPGRRATANNELPLQDAVDGACGGFGRGWELAEYAKRRAEIDNLTEERRRINVLWPPSANVLIRAKRTAAFAALEARRTRWPEVRSQSS